jgi:hypothetical protein
MTACSHLDGVPRTDRRKSIDGEKKISELSRPDDTLIASSFRRLRQTPFGSLLDNIHHLSVEGKGFPDLATGEFDLARDETSAIFNRHRATLIRSANRPARPKTL